MDSQSISEESDVSTRWSTLCGRIEKTQVIYFSQMIIVFTVIVACIVNLSIIDSPSTPWATILSGTVGYILPAPKIRKNKKAKNVTLLPDSTQQ